MNNDKPNMRWTTLSLALVGGYDVAVALAAYLNARDEVLDDYGVEDIYDLPDDAPERDFFIRVAQLGALLPVAQ